MYYYNSVFIIGSTIRPERKQHFTPEQRLQQIIETSKSIRSRLENTYLILAEGSKISREEEALLEQHFNLVIQCGNSEESKEYVNNTNIGIGESYLLRSALFYMRELKINTNYLFKISSRYRLNDNFDLKNYDPINYNFLPEVCNDQDVYCTQLYSIPVTDVEFFDSVLENCPDMMDETKPIERVFYNRIPKERVTLQKVLGVEGEISYNGTHLSK